MEKPNAGESVFSTRLSDRVSESIGCRSGGRSDRREGGVERVGAKRPSSTGPAGPREPQLSRIQVGRRRFQAWLEEPLAASLLLSTSALTRRVRNVVEREGLLDPPPGRRFVLVGRASATPVRIRRLLRPPTLGPFGLSVEVTLAQGTRSTHGFEVIRPPRRLRPRTRAGFPGRLARRRDSGLRVSASRRAGELRAGSGPRGVAAGEPRTSARFCALTAVRRAVWVTTGCGR